MPYNNKITLRAVKGSSLTHTEVDSNFQRLYVSASTSGSALFMFRSSSDYPYDELAMPTPKGIVGSVQLKKGAALSGSGTTFTGSKDLTFDFDNKVLTVTGSSYYKGDVTVDGRMTAKVFQSQTIIASTSTGSTSFGDTADDFHIRTGSFEVLGNSTNVGVLGTTGFPNISSSIGALENFSSSLDNFYTTDVDHNASASAHSSSAHLDRTARIQLLSGSSHNQREVLYTYNSASIVTLSGSAHVQRSALFNATTLGTSTLSASAHIDRVAKVNVLSGSTHTDRIAKVNVLSGSAHTDRVAKVALLSASIHTTTLKNTTDTFTGNLDVIGRVSGSADFQGSDINILHWGSVSASLAAITVSAGASDVTINNNADNRVITATGTDALNGEANLTWDGTSFQAGGTKIRNFGTSDTDITTVLPNALSGSILEGFNGGSLVVGLRDDTFGQDAFSIIGGGGQYYSTGNYTHRLFNVSGSGDVTVLGKLSTGGNLDVTGTITATSDITAYYSSDKRLKDNITNITNPIQKVQAIGGYEFDWNSLSEKEGHDVGVIAQEIESVLPELVVNRDNGYKAVRYEKIVALLIEAIKDQQLQIDELKTKLL
tara:strand:- start:59 stop:1858 length:1800 start_codon:yes stop_codon:yes gene_type:complete